MTHFRRYLATALASLSLFAFAPSWAEGGTAEAPSRDAATHFDRGVKLYEEQDWRAALVEFERAYAVSPHYRVLYDIAQCRYQLHDYVGALGAFQKYLTEGGGELPQARGEQARSAIDDLRGRVAHLRVTTDVEGAEVQVDDATVGTTPLSAPLLVNAGRRKVAASKAGRVGAVRVVDVAGEDSIDVALRLAPSPTTDSVKPTVKPMRAKSPAPAIVAFSCAVAGAGVGALFGALALGSKQELDRACVAKACPASSQSLIDQSQRNATISTIGASVGVAGLVAGIAYLLFVPAGGSAAAPGTARGVPLGVHLFVTPDSAGAVGTF
jgi:hypothetical protein